MKFDIIITTYNRPDSVLNLVQQINECTILPQSIIVVDSSDVRNLEVSQTQRVSYIHSSHKNQPYQRYLGFIASKEDIVVFMDDDVSITNKDIFKIHLDSITKDNVVGSTVRYTQEGLTNAQSEVGNLRQVNSFGAIIYFLWWLTGTPRIKDGRVWLAGLRGADNNNVYTESFGGPGTLCFKREIVTFLFDDLIFSLYEKKMGKGEDKYISMGAIKHGKLCYNNIPCLQHPPNESSYFQDLTSFYRRELFSRLLLSRRYLTVKGKWIGWGYIHYYWFAFWRILIAGIHCLLHPREGNFQIFKGKLLGVIDTVKNPFKAEYLCPDINWADQFAKDLKTLKVQNHRK